MHWVARFGVPLDMTSDRGPQLVSALWKDMSNCSARICIGPPPITRKRTAWWKDSTGTLSQPSELASPVRNGLTSFPGYCWGSARHPKRTSTARPPSSFSGPPSRFRVTSFEPQRHRQTLHQSSWHYDPVLASWPQPRPLDTAAHELASPPVWLTVLSSSFAGMRTRHPYNARTKGPSEFWNAETRHSSFKWVTLPTPFRSTASSPRISTSTARFRLLSPDAKVGHRKDQQQRPRHRLQACGSPILIF